MGHVTLRGVGKAYRRYRGKWSRLAEWIDPDRRIRHELHWVLRDVSLSIAPGEAVGILGHNGAGKSTLLKIITGTTRATAGSVDVGGRIAALLELGMGFHPDFTGRQNAYMSGQLLGYSAEQISQSMAAIEEFAEIGAYIDEPVRTYSSGMQMRLAFSVATTMRPSILVVDEALSVGDAYFQAKCIDRIRSFRRDGTTLLFVSHSPGAVKSLCERAVLLDHGCVIRDGAPDDVLDYYNATIAKQQAHSEIVQSERRTGERRTRSGGREATIESVELLSARTGLPVRAVSIGEPVELRVDFVVREPVEDLTVGVLLRDAIGNDVFGTNTFHHGRSLSGLEPGSRHSLAFDFPSLDLGRGNYTASVALHAGDVHALRSYDWWDHALAWHVVPGERPFAVGVADLPVRIRWLSGEGTRAGAGPTQPS